MATIALYGGSFNPPHAGHMLAAAYVLQAAPVDGLWVLPVFRHALDKALTVGFDDRVQLCRLAFGWLGDGVQVRDDERGGNGRTLDLVRRLHQVHPGHHFRLVLGSDILHERHRWHCFDDLARLAPPLLLRRGGFDVPDDCPYDVLPISLPDVRSRDLRTRLAARQSVAGLLPLSVERAIVASGLYLQAASL